jgi:hypothetical protein
LRGGSDSGTVTMEPGHVAAKAICGDWRSR